MPRGRFYVELAPGYVRLRHQLGYREDMRRSAIAADMAGEAAKSGQKVPPDGFGTVGRYFGTFGHRAGFKPTVELLEVEADVWGELNRRLTLLDALRKQAGGKQVSESAKRRRSWQGLTVGGIDPDEYATLYLRAHAAAIRKRGTQEVEGEASPEVLPDS